MTKQEQLDELRKQVEECRKCSLHHTATQKVFGVGDPDAWAVVVGEAPGQHEDFRGEPFVGRSGKVLRECLYAAHFRKGDIFITNTLCCRPPENREPTPAEVGACFSRLHSLLSIINPRVVIAVGSVAFKHLCPEIKKKIGAARGDVFTGSGHQVIPVWHPAFVCRQQRHRPELVRDLTKAYDFGKSMWKEG